MKESIVDWRVLTVDILKQVDLPMPALEYFPGLKIDALIISYSLIN
jgi:hypothetical protein